MRPSSIRFQCLLLLFVTENLTSYRTGEWDVICHYIANLFVTYFVTSNIQIYDLVWVWCVYRMYIVHREKCAVCKTMFSWIHQLCKYWTKLRLCLIISSLWTGETFFFWCGNYQILVFLCAKLIVKWLRK